MGANMNRTAEAAARVFRALGIPTRLLVVMALAQEGEACVCHLVAMLGMRQALVSQHLMALRKAGLVVATRRGRYVYYRLRYPWMAGWIRRTLRAHKMEWPRLPSPARRCPCPTCQAKAPAPMGR